MGKGNKKDVKRRKSIFSIIIVVLFICLGAFLTLHYIKNRDAGDEEQPPRITHRDEEDKMLAEYSKINSELNGMYAFAIVDNHLVAVTKKTGCVNIVPIDPNKEYDYTYYDTKLYLLEKATGLISVVPLKTENEYKVESTINLESNIDSFEVYNNDIFYISQGKLYKYSNGQKEEWASSVKSKNVVIKKEELYFVKDNNLVKLDMQKQESTIAQDVKEIYYYNYYERNKIIYDLQYDDENVFKSVFNFYTSEITNSVKNNSYFIPFNSSEYIYLTNDRKNIMKIMESGSSKYLYSSEVEIEDIVFLKEGSLLVKTKDKNIIVKISTGTEEKVDNIIDFHNIKYLK